MVERNAAVHQEAEIPDFTFGLPGIAVQADFDQTRGIVGIEVTGPFHSLSDNRPGGVVDHDGVMQRMLPVSTTVFRQMYGCPDRRQAPLL